LRPERGEQRLVDRTCAEDPQDERNEFEHPGSSPETRSPGCTPCETSGSSPRRRRRRSTRIG
jgi:hypothetical protein